MTLASILIMSLLSQEIDCLATTVYHEARGEPYAGQVAVALVVYNRVLSQHFPDTTCEVMLQPYQFSFVTNNLHLSEPEDRKAWEIAQKVSQDVFDMPIHAYERPMNGALYFHSGRYPGWDKSIIEKVVVIGEHKFYANREN